MLKSPNDSYDAQNAFNTLSRFPSDLTQKALESLAKDGTIVKSRTIDARRVPGRAFALSDRFDYVFKKGVYKPALFNDAADVHWALQAGRIEEFHMFESILSGEVACVLDYLANGLATLEHHFSDDSYKIRLREHERFENADSNFKFRVDVKFQSVNHNSNSTSKAPLKRPLSILGDVGELVEVSDEAEIEMRKRISRNPVTMPEQKVYAAASGYYQDVEVLKANMRGKFREDSIYQSVFDVIYKADSGGLSFDQIKVPLTFAVGRHKLTIFHPQAVSGVINAEKLKAVLAELEMIKCLDSAAPLIQKFGFKTFRWIHRDKAQFWSAESTFSPEDNFDVREGRSSLDDVNTPTPSPVSFTAEPVVPPYHPVRTWYSLSGILNAGLLKKFLRTILSMIVRNPGMKESELIKAFSHAISYCEVKELLDMLIKKTAIRSKTVFNPKEMTLFSPIFSSEEGTLFLIPSLVAHVTNWGCVICSIT